MSAFGSSSINKSGKIVVPKALPRRRNPPTPGRSITETKTASNVATRSSTNVSKEPVKDFQDPKTAKSSGSQELRQKRRSQVSVEQEESSSRRATRGRKQTNSQEVVDPSQVGAQLKKSDVLTKVGPIKTRSRQNGSQTSNSTTEAPSLRFSQIIDLETPSEQLWRENEFRKPENPKSKSKDVFVVTTSSVLDGASTASAKQKKFKTRSAEDSASGARTDKSSSNTALDSLESAPLSHMLRSSRMKKSNRSPLVKSSTLLEKPSLAIDEEETESTPTEADSIRSRKRRRMYTPDGNEDVTIVPSMVTMFELSSRRSRIGKLSEREKKMRQIDWDAVGARRKEDENRMAYSKGSRVALPKDDRELVSEDENEEEDIDAQIAKAARGNRDTRQGIQIRVVNGEHLVDPESQKVDRHALANQDMETLEEFEEDDLTKKFNSHTYIHMKRRDPVERIPSKDKWTSEDTEKFYQFISQFGTDFLIISRMFPGRSRRHIKAKFIREERSDPDRIKRALVGEERQAWDLDAYKQATGLGEDDFRDPRQVEEELRQRREEREKEIEAQKRETEELQRQKRLAGHVDENEEYEEGNDNGIGALDEEILEVIDE